MLDARLLNAAPDYALARFGGVRPDAPDWYERLREAPVEQLRTTVEGASIEVLAWGERGRPGLLLVHGNRAHAHWWGPIGPLLARDYRVAALSLSGMGGSDWRDRYSSALHSAELFAAIAAAGLGDGPCAPIVIAHSFGGMVAANALRDRARTLGGTLFVDSLLLPAAMRPSARITERDVGDYPDRASALARFRLSPTQPSSAPYMLHDAACAGLIEEGARWRWRFDPFLVRKLDMDDPWPAIVDPPCPIAFVYGEQSALATPAILAAQRAGLAPGTPFVGIPGAWHHVMFDQPFALVAAIRAFAAEWLAPQRRSA